MCSVSGQVSGPLGTHLHIAVRATIPAKLGIKASMPTGGIAAKPSRVAGLPVTRRLTRRLFIDYQGRCSCACS
jgi:hypothetical protein